MNLFLLLACAGRHSVAPEVDPLDGPLAAADLVWDARAEPGGIERASSAYQALVAIAPEDPRVFERLARTHHRVGLVGDPARSAAEYETAREYALACAAGTGEMRVVLQSGGYRWTPEIADRVPRGIRTACLGWAAAADVGLVEARGSGSALLLAEAETLGTVVVRRRSGDAMATRTLAMVHLLAPDADAASRAEGVRLLSLAIELDPEFHPFRVDLGRALGTPQALPDDGGAKYALENAWAREQPAPGPLRPSGPGTTTLPAPLNEQDG